MVLLYLDADADEEGQVVAQSHPRRELHLVRRCRLVRPLQLHTPLHDQQLQTTTASQHDVTQQQVLDELTRKKMGATLSCAGSNIMITPFSFNSFQRIASLVILYLLLLGRR